MSVGTMVLAGLEASILLLKQFPDYDQRKAAEFEADYELYKTQQTLPDDHPDINDSLFLRVRNRLQRGQQEINAFVRARGKNSKHVPSE